MAAAPYLVAHVWRCGDVCCCSEPRVELILTDAPWPKRCVLWTGEFRCDREPDEKQEDLDEIRAVCEAFAIPFDGSGEYGEREVAQDEAYEIQLPKITSRGPVR